MLSARDFGDDYYAHHCGRPYRRDEVWLEFFGRIADHIVRAIGPARVLDAGCALGFLVELLRKRGVEAYGFDLSSYAIANVDPSIRPFCWEASVASELKDDYDLIVCMEVFAHVPPDAAETAIESFCAHTNDVLFSSSPVAPGVRRHVNLHPPEHWAEAFARQGFYRDFAFDASFMTPWAVRFRRGDRSASDLVRAYERHILDTRDAIRIDEQRAAAAQIQTMLESAAQSQDTIAKMQRSWFWKARRPWKALTGR